VEYGSAEGQADRLPALAADMVQRRVAVIATMANNAAVAVKATTTTIPIVFTVGGDPVKMGLVDSLNRPGGNITGVSFLASDIVTKMLEALHEQSSWEIDCKILTRHSPLDRQLGKK